VKFIFTANMMWSVQLFLLLGKETNIQKLKHRLYTQHIISLMTNNIF